MHHTDSVEIAGLREFFVFFFCVFEKSHFVDF